MEGTVRSRRDGAVLELVLDNPARRNAVSAHMLEALAAALKGVDPAAGGAGGPVRAVLLRGAGERAFSAGYDLTALPSDSAEGADFGGAAALAIAAQAIVDCPVPVVALLLGACFGAGGELATACDLRVAGTGLKFGMPPAKIGLVYSDTGLARFVGLIGPARTKELFLTAQPASGEWALAAGLVDRLLPPAEAESAAWELCRTMAANAPLAVAGMKRIVNGLALAPRPEDTGLYAQLRLQAFQSEDYQEGRVAMLEKRAPDFHGR